MCLAMTHEEVMADLARQIVSSYRQLPFMLYQIQTKFRDEPRPRAGVIRVREFTMKDAYTFDRDYAGLDRSIPASIRLISIFSVVLALMSWRSRAIPA